MTASPFADAAERLAVRGFRVFRIRAGQKTGGARWVHGGPDEAATSDPKEIRRRATRWPRSNIGIATGCGVAVLDVDTDKGGLRPAWATPTLEARTPSGGFHCYYLTDGRVRGSVEELAAGVDVRGDGNMVVAPPSVTESGAYEWLTEPDTPMAFLPAWQFHQYTRSRSGGSPLAGAERLRAEDIRAGCRHDQLVRWCSFFASEGREGDDLERVTHAFNRRLTDPLPAEEITAIVDWIDARETAARETDAALINVMNNQAIGAP